MRRALLSLATGGMCAAVLFLPAFASAQQRASIVGLVQDSTGAVLPGVTVEAASDVLIERVRSVITDSAGGTPSSTCGPAPTT